MNLEHLCKQIKEKYHLLKNKKKTFLLLKYHFNILKDKKKKLKLGFIVFEIKEYKNNENFLIITETIDIRYTRQDNTAEDELKLENLINSLNWKWDFSNIGAFLIICFILYNFISNNIYLWYLEYFPSFSSRDIKFDNLIELTFDFFFLNSEFEKKIIFIKIPTQILIETLLKFIFKFNMLL